MHNRWLHEAEPGAPFETDVAKNQGLGIYHGSFGGIPNHSSAA